MFTKIDIVSQALLKMGEKPIQSFNGDAAAAQLARSLYEPTVDALLSMHPWKFATRQFTLAKTTDSDFLLPSEIIRVLSANGDYKIEGDRIKSNAGVLTVCAIARVSNDQYPAYFIPVLSARLAMEFCMPLTDNAQMFKSLAAIYESELRVAKFVDATTAPAPEAGDFSLLSARY